MDGVGRVDPAGGADVPVSPTWETASDWDAATSEDGVVHESVANTDHDDDTIVQQGYDYANFSEITPTPDHAYPFHEDSGTTANDLAGSNNGTINGATVNQEGLLGTTAYSFDGTDDYVDIPDPHDFSTAFTISFWAKPTVLSTGSSKCLSTGYDGSNIITQFEFRDESSNGDVDTHGINSTFYNIITGKSISQNTWYHIAQTYDGSTMRYYNDATEQGNASVNFSDTSTPTYVGAHYGTGSDADHAAANIADVRFYPSALSASQIQTLYDVVDTPGTLTTDYRSG